MRRLQIVGTRDLWVGRCLAGASILYLLPFVTRWWIPFDEGMIGQTADRVLHGQLPHVDFQEPYSGGLSWVYSLVFRFWGIDLAHVRWLLFLLAIGAVCLLYDIFRRYLPPTGAALATWVAVVWSFPNYFAGLPSWWLLVCALVAVWGFCRFEDSGARWPLLAAAFATGSAVAVKQTGVYQVIAFAAALSYSRALPGGSRWRVDIWLRPALAIAALGISGGIVWRAGGVAECVFVFVPIATVALAVLASSSDPPATALDGKLAASVMIALALPVAGLLAPYVWRGAVTAFVSGAFVQPQARFVYAHVGMLPPTLILFGVPVALLLTGSCDRWIGRHRALAWLVAIALLATVPTLFGYQTVWQSTRAAAALLPPAVWWRLPDTADLRERRIQLFAASFLAWLSLNQIPSPHPVYFCYVAPLAVVCGVALHSSSGHDNKALVPWASVLIAFGVLVINRGTLDTIGRIFPPPRPVAALNLRRAHLSVFPESARWYQSLVPLIERHARQDGLMAGPDCPEVFFLTGQYNPTGVIFDFLGGTTTTSSDAAWFGRDIVVINHAPAFSPPLSPVLQGEIRNAYQQSETIGPFEIRWAR
jgi:hypothetical protein